ncbi:4-hydroxybenzoate polyprenyltransferase [Formivibrio citricus]|uniref:4-hydroxybenzoate polyprenyltransferase n=1 Tax=Formivibrio citricus TaxID=83765 RepID=A0A1I5C257_9NEIS|nr:UbiA family prenyltransferase [Formivibrio citricus]SFN81093.1 4-hydroxybenzoate polyprenyltransferase [Formivibrio citricus]
MKPATTPANPDGFFWRWHTYFSERFPPLQHGLLIAAFCFGVLSYAARVAMPAQKPGAMVFVVAFVTAFLMILQLRILDEFKDFEEDARWRPYRPVPRGLISLASLRRLWFMAAAVQVGVALLLDARLLAGLLAVWLYSGLMGVEFFIRDWLKAHPLVYMLSHILIVPMIATYVAACHWLPQGMKMPDLAGLLAASYFAFCVIEVGRKIRAPVDEEEGVETYTALWGAHRALAAWLGFMITGSAFAVLAALRIQSATFVATLLGAVLLFAMLGAVAFLRSSGQGGGTRFNRLSGLWTLILFLGLGLGSFY